jgi:hypothetical protein
MIQAAILGICLVLFQSVVRMDGGVLPNTAGILLFLSALFTISSLIRDNSRSQLKESDLGGWFPDRDQRRKQTGTCLGLGIIALSGAIMLTASAWLLG